MPSLSLMKWTALAAAVLILVLMTRLALSPDLMSRLLLLLGLRSRLELLLGLRSRLEQLLSLMSRLELLSRTGGTALAVAVDVLAATSSGPHPSSVSTDRRR